ncbi:hypothetical protein E1091_08590 [Micromonospora fluostatini]|uniref:Uncharacterized protein n=1 Tax=Micromonospora fluostatini TaxID=1629071 RepID=A0ABY2DHP0_9ACTN|nr:hypothetical protein E1091_08590 [Micromonospora fluostatini]
MQAFPSLGPDNGPTVTCGPHEPRRQPRPWLPGVIVVIIVTAASAALLTAGLPMDQALFAAAALVLLSGEVARRIVGTAGALPTVVVTAAVAACAGLLLHTGRSLTEVVVAVGLTGVLAGEVATRLLGFPRPRWGV